MNARSDKHNQLFPILLLSLLLVGFFGQHLNGQNLSSPLSLTPFVNDPMRIPDRAIALDFETGININFLKEPREEEVELASFKPGVSYAIGASVLLLPKQSISFLVGARYLFDRGRMENLSIGQYVNPNSNTDRRPIRERVGEVPVRDKSWRIEFMMRFKVMPRIYGLFGFQGSHINGGKQVFSYEETLYRVYNPLSDQFHELPNPITTIGEETIRRAKRQGGVLLGLEYHPGGHFFGRLLWDTSESSGFGGDNTNRKQNFTRLTLSLGYRL